MDRTPRQSVSHRQIKPAKPSVLVPILAALCFLGAVAFAAYPAIRAGASSLGGILLLVGLAGVVSIGFFAFSGNPTGSGQSEDTSEAEVRETLVHALNEPAAVAADDGRILAANPAWRLLLGQGMRLPKAGKDASSLFTALTAARRGEVGSAQVRADGEDHPVQVSTLAASAKGRRSYLIRMTGLGMAEPRRLSGPQGLLTDASLDIPA
jgi:two-component system cell cycle sensor histidine kinase/response regulator CckA